MNFASPPVVEVSCQISFKPLKLYGPYMGLLWAEWQDDFLFCREIGSSPQRPTERASRPAGETYEFFNEDESRSLTISRQSLRYTWKQSRNEESYPRFPAIFASFQEYVQDVNRFSREAEIGDVEVQRRRRNFSFDACKYLLFLFVVGSASG